MKWCAQRSSDRSWFFTLFTCLPLEFNAGINQRAFLMKWLQLRACERNSHIWSVEITYVGVWHKLRWARIHPCGFFSKFDFFLLIYALFRSGGLKCPRSTTEAKSAHDAVTMCGSTSIMTTRSPSLLRDSKRTDVSRIEFPFLTRIMNLKHLWISYWIHFLA